MSDDVETGKVQVRDRAFWKVRAQRLEKQLAECEEREMSNEHNRSHRSLVEEVVGYFSPILTAMEHRLATLEGFQDEDVQSKPPRSTHRISRKP